LKERFFTASLVLLLLTLAMGSGSAPEMGTAATLGANANPASVLIFALYYDGYQKGDIDEAFQLMNVGDRRVDITGWSVTDNEGTISFPAATFLDPGEKIWCAQTAIAFKEELGFLPDFEYGGDSDPVVPNMSGTMPRFANKGDEVILRDATEATIIDALVYKDGNTTQRGWNGEAVQPYRAGRSFREEGQILYRKLDQTTGRSVLDTDTAADWAQDPHDPINGKKVMYPGWALDAFFQTIRVREAANLAILVAPDNIFDAVKAQIEAAQESIYIQVYTFKHVGLAEAVAKKAGEGVEVRILLEGDSGNKGIEDQEKWVSQLIERAGGQVYFMINDPENGINDRYDYQHAKFIIIDGKVLIMGSENLGYGGMPDDDKSDGTRGRRGAALITNAPTLVAHVQSIFAADLDLSHKDIFRWQADHERYGAPSPDFIPDCTSGGSAYPILKPEPLTLEGTFTFEIIQSPENSLRDQDSLLGRIAQAKEGDTILVEQMYEYKHWGPKGSSPEQDPNPRLEAYIAAARDGARVRILLDRFFLSNFASNLDTCDYINNIAERDGLDLEIRLGNPTGADIRDERMYGGIHNKMVLGWIGGQGYVHIGSINGSEVSSKVNRELAIQVQSDEVYYYLYEVFDYDWSVSMPCG